MSSHHEQSTGRRRTLVRAVTATVLGAGLSLAVAAPAQAAVPSGCTYDRNPNGTSFRCTTPHGKYRAWVVCTAGSSDSGRINGYYVVNPQTSSARCPNGYISSYGGYQFGG